MSNTTNNSNSPQAPTTPDALAFSPDDAGNAQYCAEVLRDRYLYVPAYKWLRYAATHWEVTGATEGIQSAVIDALRKRQETGLTARHATIAAASTPNYSRIHAAVAILQSYLLADVSEFDASPDQLNVGNGVLDLRTGQLMPHDPSQRFSYCTGVAYDPVADDSLWLDFLRQAVSGDDEILDYLQLAVGYTLTGHIREEVFFYLYGPTRSGKGTFTETIRRVLGLAPLSAEVGFNTFTLKRGGDANNFDLAPLKPCRFVAAGESDRYDRLSSPDIKRFTGGDSIRCSFKYGPVFEYRPQFKIWLASNAEVLADPDDGALWARLRIITFPNSRVGQEDKGLKQRLQQREALEGVLKWAVAGSMRWYTLDDGGLAQPDSVAAMAQEARAASDSVGQWIEERVTITPNPQCFTPNPELYASYEDYCKVNGVRYPKQMASVTRSLKAKGYAAGEEKCVNGHTTRGCYGITV